MTTLIGFSGRPPMHALGWTLLHFCWQGAVVAVVLWCVLEVLGERRSRVRYAASCLALGMMVALPLATFAHLASADHPQRAAFDGSAVVIDAGMVLQVGEGVMTAPLSERIAMALDHALPWVLLTWFAGVILFVVRLNVGLLVARKMRSIATTAVPAELQQAFDALRRRLGVERAVRLMHSALVQAPTVIGWLRPVVLIPASCLSGLSTMQIEAVLAHELAHIRRHDYLVSVLQSAIETLLFYHPAVWWVSRQVRRERECCCDEMAVAVGGDRLAYARALSVLEERRAAMPELALGANGGVLTMRIRRLLGHTEASTASQLVSIALLAALVLAAGAVAGKLAHAQNGTAQANSSASSAAQVAVEPDARQSAVVSAAIGPANGPPPSLSTAGQQATSETERQIENAQRRLQGAQELLNSEKFKKQIEDAQRWLQNAQAKPDSPEFKKQIQDAQRQLQEVQERLNSEQFKKQIEDAQRWLQNAQAKTNSPEFKKQMEDVQRQLLDAQKKLNSEQFKKQMDDAQRQLQDAQKNPNSEQFKKQMEDAQRQLQDAQKKLNSEQFKKQMEDAQRQLQDAQKKLNSDQFKGQIAQLLAQNAMIAKASGGQAGQANARATQGEGTIAGSIVDQTGAAVPRAKVTATNTDNGTQVSTETDSSGKYSISPLQPGQYNVEVVATGFQRMLQNNVHVDSGKTVGLDLKLTVGASNYVILMPVLRIGGTIVDPKGTPVSRATVTAVNTDSGKKVTATTDNTGKYVLTLLAPGRYNVEVEAKGFLRLLQENVQVDDLGPAGLNFMLSVGGAENLSSPAAPPVQGAVILHALVSKTGAVEDLDVISGAGMPRSSATDAVMQKAQAQAEQDYNDGRIVPIQIGGDVTPPVLIWHPSPDYTEEARKAKVNGNVTVSLIVNNAGIPLNVHVTKGVGLGLDEKAVEAVKRYRFKPASENGKPVPVYMNIEVNFEIF